MCDNVQVVVFKPTTVMVVLGILRNVLIIALLICVFQVFWLRIKQRRVKRKTAHLDGDLARLESLTEEKED